MRLASTAALVTAVGLFVVGWLGLIVYDQRLDDDAADGLAARYDAVALAVAQRGPAAASSAADQPLRGGAVQVLSPSGRLLASVPAGAPSLLGRDELTAAGPGVVARQGSYAGAPVVLRYASIRAPDGSRVVVAAAASLRGNRDAVSRVRELLLVSWLPAALLAGVGAWLLAGRALAPIDRVLAHATRARVSDETIDWWVPPTGDEVERLARVVGELVQRLHDAVQDQQDRFADAAHELRTPLTSLRGELDVLARGPLAGDEGLRAARDSARRLSELVEHVLVLGLNARGAALLRLRVTSVAEVVDAVVTRRRRRVTEGVTLTARVTDDLPAVVCDPTRLEQVLDNLVANAVHAVHAVHAAASAGTVTIEATVTDDGQTLVVAVSDDGPGFAGVAVGPVPARVFERFHHAPAAPRDLIDNPAGNRAAGPADGPDGGLGLGLAIVRELVLAHGGDVTAANRPGGGAVVSVRLPVRGPSDALLSD